jgi:hypothetical protein
MEQAHSMMVTLKHERKTRARALALADDTFALGN